MCGLLPFNIEWLYKKLTVICVRAHVVPTQCFAGITVLLLSYAHVRASLKLSFTSSYSTKYLVFWLSLDKHSSSLPHNSRLNKEKPANTVWDSNDIRDNFHFQTMQKNKIDGSSTSLANNFFLPLFVN